MILVVDNDPEVLARASEVLNRDRHVFLASTAEQAVEMVDKLGLRLSVVLVDIDLPGAYALIQKLHDANPSFCSSPSMVLSKHRCSKPPNRSESWEL